MTARMMWTLVVAVAVVVTAACGDSKSSLLPTAPSALSAETAGVDASTAGGEYGTTANGPKPGNGNGNNNGGGNGNGNGNGNDNGNGNGNGNGNSPRTPSNPSPNAPTPVPPGRSVVQFEGLIDAVGGASVTVSGQTLMVTSNTVIRHGNRRFELSQLYRGDRVHVRANRVAAGGGAGSAAQATLEAAEIKLQNPGDGVSDDEGPASGPVPAVDPDQLVSVTAVDDSAIEASADSGAFRLTRVGTAAQLALPLPVSFTLGGTASAADYAPVVLTASFLANQATVDVIVMPVNDGMTESPESVELTLSAGAGYEPGSPSTATVTIADAPPPQLSIWVADSFASEIENSGRFEITRSGDLSGSLTVTMEFSGTAQLNVDYMSTPAPTSSGILTYTFVPGQGTLRVTVMPFNDTVTEPQETIVLTVVDGADYDLGPTPTGTITIAAR